METNYERHLFEKVKKEFWQGFTSEKDKLYSFLEGVCKVFDTQIAFMAKKEGERLKILNVYPSLKGEIRIGEFLKIDDGLKTMLTRKEGYSCNTMEEGTSLKELGIKSFLVIPCKPIELEEYIFLCNRSQPAKFNEEFLSYDIFLYSALERIISILLIEDIQKEICTNCLDKIVENTYEQVWREVRLEKKIEVFYKVTNRLNTPGETSEILEGALEILKEELKVKDGAILLIDENTKRLGVISALGVNKEKIKGCIIDRGEGIERWVVDKNESKYINYSDKKFYSEIAKQGEINAEKILASPIKIEEKVIGIIMFFNKPIPFTDEDSELISTVGNMIGMTIQTWRVVKEELKKVFGPYLPDVRLIDDSKELRKVRREKVTILVADMSGFSKMVEKLGRDEGMVETLNEYFTKMSEIIFEQDGIVDKFIGDGIMGIFWAQNKAISAKNALCAVFDMKETFAQLRKGLQKKWEKVCPEEINIDLRFGISTDWVFIGDIGSDIRKSYTAIGKGVNLAFRLVSEVDDSNVWIDAPTYQLCREIITKSSHDVKTFKGFNDPVHVYEITSIKQESPEEIYKKVIEFKKANRIGKALLCLDKIIRRHGSLDLEEMFVEKVKLLKLLGEDEESGKVCKKALAKFPNFLRKLEERQNS